MKTRIILILAVFAALAAIALAAFLLNPSFLLPHDLTIEKEEGLPEDQTIVVKTKVEGLGIHKGDAFPYVVEVWYNPAKVSEIDKTSLDKNVNLKPFELRDTKDTEFDLDSRTRVYRRQYEMQLIDGKLDYLYKFPTIIIRYRLKDSPGFSEKAGMPEPIFIASRLPPDISGLELRPLKGQIEDVGQKYLPWILWAFGGFLAALGVVDLAWRAIPQWKGTAEQRRSAESSEVLIQAYRSLRRNVAAGTEARHALHQVDRILRIVLARKEMVGWLEEPNLDLVSPNIRPLVISLLEKLEENHATEVVEQEEPEEAMKQTEEILKFYFGAKEVETWRS